MKIGEDQGLVEGNLAEEIKQVLDLLLKDLMGQWVGTHQFVELLQP